MQEKFFDILENEEVEDVVDLNEKFLSQQLGVEQDELALLPKIELRVDTRFHNLQVTGEILSSLEHFKLSDSIIQNFRDIGTSFKNVRVLNIARCELKDVNGMQAFAQLEELYIGYNDLDELFDIGFLEHLQVLDFEGNNLKDLDQLYYLRRNRHMINLNLKLNPVAYGKSIGSKNGPSAQPHQKITEYYERVRDCCPKLEEFDDENITEGFFQHKIDNVHSLDTFETQTDGIKHLDFFTRFMKLGLTSERINELTKADVQEIEDEEPEELLLLTTIKNQTPEQKAQRDFDLMEITIDDKPMRPRSSYKLKIKKDHKFRNTTQGFNIKRGDSSRDVSVGQNENDKDPMRQSTMYFLKQVFNKNQSI